MSKAKTLMIQGTGSGVGKSAIVAALCRIYVNFGVRVAPFKAQNMSLNSGVTALGHEIGRAQYFQAQAAGIEPDVDMNPLLLKPAGEQRSHVILQGKPWGLLKAGDFELRKRLFQKFILESFERLSHTYDMVIIEGAGSPAEINLKKGDVVNMEMAKKAKAPVLLIGDIDRGGVFAWLKGTIDLLPDDERLLIQGCIINRFRGDMRLLSPGIVEFERLSGKKIVGVIPFVEPNGIDEEDGQIFTDRIQMSSKQCSKRKIIRISVIKLPHISNFTDFEVFGEVEDVELEFVNLDGILSNPHVLILPGSRNTIEDLKLLREAGMDKRISEAFQNGAVLIGICGGYQMLGEEISDPNLIEGSESDIRGLGYLKIRSEFYPEKTLKRVSGKSLLYNCPFAGYEIHHGRTEGSEERFAILEDAGGDKSNLDGHYSFNGRVWGTYVHGIFDNPSFLKAFLNAVIKSDFIKFEFKPKARWQHFINFTNIVKESLDLNYINKIAKIHIKS